MPLLWSSTEKCLNSQKINAAALTLNQIRVTQYNFKQNHSTFTVYGTSDHINHETFNTIEAPFVGGETGQTSDSASNKDEGQGDGPNPSKVKDNEGGHKRPHDTDCELFLTNFLILYSAWELEAASNEVEGQGDDPNPSGVKGKEGSQEDNDLEGETMEETKETKNIMEEGNREKDEAVDVKKD
ncbi:hypothetical protein F2Q70_00002064 [Brassica cretica]|uniref:Uncharacterized protein n=1 Tax=Brassica cretica TaxID=69181 RepID=A0A8S9IQV3_BRACR|nr:hypothetical protein F2Q70_00002064 [Brassica cretica]